MSSNLDSLELTFFFQAEQLWNISNQLMVARISDVNEREYMPFIADFLRHAHDFALLSDEEADALLTKGFLARERFNNDVYASKYINFSSKDSRSTDLCSEFSVQCLLSSVANVIDYVSREDTVELCEEHSKLLESAHKCFVVAMSELTTLEMENSRAGKATIFLSLNLLVAMREDISCATVLKEGGLLSKMKDNVLSDAKGSAGSMPPLEHMYILANRAQLFGMQITAQLLFSFCCDQMISTGKTSLVHGNNTIGLIQRIIISLASTVDEVVTTFESVDQMMKRRTESSEHLSVTYSTEDVDYFIVEAHNRACSLTFMGDRSNAEKLLTVALNLLPHGSREVESYGSEIRRTYRGVIGRRESSSCPQNEFVSLWEG